MIRALDTLGLEVASLDRAREFYEETLGLAALEADDSAVVYPVGDARVVLRRPSRIPRGGLHVHYAFSTPTDAYERWYDRFRPLGATEFDFGGYRSLYVDDPDGHCVEVGNNGEVEADSEGSSVGDDDSAPPLTGIFEIVLEVRDLADAEERYRALGFEVVDRGDDRRRVRLRGPFDLELWEPQLGIADARGGVHVELGLVADDPEAAADAVAPWTAERSAAPGGVRVRESDGHVLTFVAPDGRPDPSSSGPRG